MRIFKINTTKNYCKLMHGGGKKPRKPKKIKKNNWKTT